MRYIEKTEEPPASIREFIAMQMAQEVPVNLDYDKGFGKRKERLLAELTAEQFGLCGYTGMPVDEERLEEYNNDSLHQRGASYRAHNEHIKAQSVCRTEAGERWGVEPCEDIDHRNIIAAIEVRGAAREQFGAVARGSLEIDLPPTSQDCETQLVYRYDGSVDGTTESATNTINRLGLNHITLVGYRRAKISVFLSLDAWESGDDLAKLIEVVENPTNGLLTQFSFCIASVAKQLLKNLGTSEI